MTASAMNRQGRSWTTLFSRRHKFRRTMMLGQLLAIFMILALWPLIVLCVNLAIYGRALISQIPKIRDHFGGLTNPEAGKWLGPVLVLSVVGVIVGSVLVLRSPFSGFPSSLATHPL